MNSLFEQLPEVINNASRSLYGLLAAIVITTGFLVVFLINQKATNRQERVLIYVIIFFSAISVAVGVAAGFSTGTGVTVSEPSVPEGEVLPNPLSITLEPDAMQKLEDHLQEQGIDISPEAKTIALGNAIDSLAKPAITPEEGPDPTSESDMPTGTSLETAFELEPIEAINSDYAWLGASRLNELMPQRYHQLELENDSELTITWGGQINPTILNSQGSKIRDFNLGKEGQIDLPSGTYYITARKRYTSTDPRLDYEFRVFANTVQY